MAASFSCSVAHPIKKHATKEKKNIVNEADLFIIISLLVFMEPLFFVESDR
jgi:hypothetical protein